MLKTSVLSLNLQVLLSLSEEYICTVRPYLTTSSAKTIVHSVISATLSLSTAQDFFITKLQRVQNAAARNVLKLKKYDSVTPYLMKLHWLPVRKRIIYKLNLIVFKALKGDALDYIQSLLSIKQTARPLRSGDKMYKLKEPRWKLKSKGYRYFCVAAPHYWNSLPDDVCNIELDLNDFKKILKTFLFKSVFVGVNQ